MPACSFCKKNYENPRGLTVFTFDGKSLFYCSSKCRRNAGLGRDPKKTNWVKSEKRVKVKSEKVEVRKKDEDLEKPVEGTKGKSARDDKTEKVEKKDDKSKDVVDNKKDKKEEVKVEEKKEEKKEEKVEKTQKEKDIEEEAE